MLKIKKWIPLFVTQFLGVLNDNILKFAVIFISISWLANEDQEGLVVGMAGALLLLPFVLFSPLAGSLVNRKLSFHSIENQEFSFFQEKPISDFKIVSEKSQDPEGYFTFFIMDGNVERVKSKKRLFKNVEKGTTIVLPFQKGLFGYEVVRMDLTDRIQVVLD